jgi:spermidine synthase
MGELILQRRRIAEMGDAEAYEVKLNGEYLMSSLFHEAEVALADLALARLPGSDWEVAVGGLGLGYTAAAALAFKQLKRLVIVEALEPVIDWHRKGLVPNGRLLTDDPRCVYHHADFFALARGSGFNPGTPDYQLDAILLDIDHTPKHLLAVGHTDFYTEAGVRRLARFLKPGGVFGLWSNEPPDDAFLAILTRVFGHAEGHVVAFDNPLQNKTSSNGIYLGRRLDSQKAVL